MGAEVVMKALSSRAAEVGRGLTASFNRARGAAPRFAFPASSPLASSDLATPLKATRPTAFVALLALMALAGCTVPHGAALLSEVVTVEENGAGTDGGTGSGATASADFAVYAVDRDFLDRVAMWPVTSETEGRWPRHAAGPRVRIVQPGDTINLAVWDPTGNSLLTQPGGRVTPLEGLRVSPSGTIFVPFVGNLQIAGDSPEIARQKIERAMMEVAPSTQVQLDMVEGSANTVNLVGGASRPGRYPMPDLSFSVLDLLAQGGGVSPALRNPKIKVQRGGDVFVTSVAALYADPARDFALRHGDDVIVEEDKRFFLSLGAAGTETVHDFTKDFISASEAVAMARGVDDRRADPGGVLVLREYAPRAVGPNGPEQARVVFTLDLTTADGLFSAQRFRINSGDLVYVTEAPVARAASILSIVGSGFGLLATVDRIRE